MNSCDIKRLALAQALIAEIDGMNVANAERSMADMSPAYNEGHFYDKAEELRELAAKHDEQL